MHVVESRTTQITVRAVPSLLLHRVCIIVSHHTASRSQSRVHPAGAIVCDKPVCIDVYVCIFSADEYVNRSAQTVLVGTLDTCMSWAGDVSFSKQHQVVFTHHSDRN